MDITDYFDVKTAAIRAYSSQVFVKGKNDETEPTTFISKPDFMEMLEASAVFGALIGVKYAEAYLAMSLWGFPHSGFGCEIL